MQRRMRTHVMRAALAAMLHFDREPVSRPQLIALDGGRPAGHMALTAARVRQLAPVLVVLAATLFAVFLDVLDTVPAWSHYAVAASAVVLAAHALLSRR